MRFPPLRHCRLLLGLTLLAVDVASAGAGRAIAAEGLSREAASARSKYAAGMRELAARCRQQGLEAEAKTTLTVLGPRDPCKLYLPALPLRVGPPPLAKDASENLVQWNERLLRLRRGHAAALWDIALRAVHQRQPSLAFALVLEVIRANPDHESARRLFGYQKFSGQWRTAFEVRKLRANQVWTDKFGWLPKTQVARYEQGQRYANGRWISAEDDARLHRDIASGWEITSEHYMIRTNHSIEAGVALSGSLENLYRLWQEIFISYYANETYVNGLFSGRSQGARAVEARRYNVVYYRDRSQYIRALGKSMPNMDKSVGVYVGKNRTAFFFAGQGSDQRTMYHEATHQLFDQSRRVSSDVGGRCNFWIVEGIAMLMETLHEEDGYFAVGGLDDVRMKAARYHLQQGDFYVPFGEMVSYSRDRLQSDPKIASIYSQAAAMTHFLVFYDGGRYRDAVVSYLIDVYTGRDNAATLARLTGQSYAQLDRQYRDFMKIGQDGERENR